MKKVILFILSGLLLFSLFSCSEKDDFVSEKAKYDIRVVKLDIGEYVLKELYNPEPLEELEYDLLNKNISRDEAVIRLSKILADYNIVHLNLNINYPEFYAEIAPFFLKLFGDEYYFSLCHKQYGKYAGCKVVEIGGFPVKTALEKYNEYFPFETESGAKYNFETVLNYKFLKAAGLLDKKGRLPVSFETQNGSVETVLIKSVEKLEMKDITGIRPAAYSSIDTNQRTNKMSAFVTDQQKKTCYYQSLSFHPFNEDNCVESLETMLKELKTNDYDTIVFDLRYNGGGQFPIIISQKFYENKEFLQNYNLAIILSGKTYSAGVIFADYLYGLFPNLVFFGEESGQAIFNYTNVLPETLPNLKCNIVFPKQVEAMDNVSKRADDVNRGILPDVEVHQTLEDYLNGVDTIYNAIYDYFN